MPLSLEFITVALLLAFAFSGLDTDLLIVLLKRRQIFASFAEFSLLHTFSDVPVHECTLAVHEVELVVNAREHLSDGGRITDHAHRAHDLRQIATRHNSRRLVVDTAFEASGAPVH